MRKMIIIKTGDRGWYRPENAEDWELFKHCCEGFIEVRGIAKYRDVFTAHSITIEIINEVSP